MNKIICYIGALFLGLFIVSCGGPETRYDIHSKSDENDFSESDKNKTYSLDNRTLSGSVDLPQNFRLLNVKILTLDKKMMPGDSVEAKLGESRFSVRARNYSNSEIQVDFSCAYGDSSFSDTLKFTQYFDILYEDDLQLNLHSAMLSPWVKSLHQEADMDLIWEKDSAFLKAETFLETPPETWNLQEQLPVLYCGGMVNAPNFAECFEKLSKGLGTKTKWDQVLSTINVADNFLRFINTNATSYSDEIYNFAEEFIESVYKLRSPLFQGDTSQILKDSSEFNGHLVICDSMPQKSGRLMWRLQNEQDELLGPCYFDLDSVVIGSMGGFACKKNSSVWETLSEEASADIYFGCKEGDTKIRFLPNGGEYLCQDGKWSSYGIRIQGYEIYEFDSRVVREVGSCTSERNGEYIYTDSFFAICKNGYWEKNDGTRYYDQECNANMKGTSFVLPVHRNSVIDTAYFYCNGKSWRDTIPPLVYGDVCNDNHRYNIAVYNGKYYMCDKSWRLLSDEELLPPILSRDSCPSAKLFKKYGESYYKCENNHWTYVEDSLVVAPVKAGIVCEEAIRNQVYKSDNEYFVCNIHWWTDEAHWIKATEHDIFLYEHRIDHDGECKKGLAGTSIYWTADDDKDYHVFCKNGEWKIQEASVTNSYLPDLFTPRNLAGGTFIDSTTYRNTIGGVEYTFRLYWRDYLVLSKIKENEETYTAHASKNMMFLSKESPSTSMSLENFVHKGDGFETFYKSWLARATVDDSVTIEKGQNTINIEKKTYYFEPQKIELVNSNEESYMDYESAVKFCPSGTHIPDTTELQENYSLGNNGWTREEESSIKATYSYVWDGTKTKEQFYSIFWSSTAKDSNTQYCLELVANRSNTYSATWKQQKRIVECPKKTYPIIKAICGKEYAK